MEPVGLGIQWLKLKRFLVLHAHNSQCHHAYQNTQFFRKQRMRQPPTKVHQSRRKTAYSESYGGYQDAFTQIEVQSEFQPVNIYN
jgi:hypothetical protein